MKKSVAKRLKKTRLKLYNTPAFTVVLRGSENWIVKAQDARITVAEMKYVKKTAVYTWTDYKTNEEITKKN